MIPSLCFVSALQAVLFPWRLPLKVMCLVATFFLYHKSRGLTAHDVLSVLLTPQLCWLSWSAATCGFSLAIISLVCPASHRERPVDLLVGKWFSLDKQNFLCGLARVSISKSPHPNSKSKEHTRSVSLMNSTRFLFFWPPGLHLGLCVKHTNSHLVSF